ADADDVELHAAHAVRDVPDDELQPAAGVERRPDECRRRHDGQDDCRAGEDQQQAAQAEHRYSFGEKLTCRRGPGCTDLNTCAVASQRRLLVRGSAMSTPSVMTGRRTRRPTPTEYCSEVHSCCCAAAGEHWRASCAQLLKALPQSKKAAIPKLSGRSRITSTGPVITSLPPTSMYWPIRPQLPPGLRK